MELRCGWRAVACGARAGEDNSCARAGAARQVLCEDASVLGTPFYVMDYSKGRLFKNPHLPGMSATGNSAAAVYVSCLPPVSAPSLAPCLV